MTGFDTVLIANRGEIAVRVIRTCKALGYRTVAVYSEADAGAPHVALADAAVCIGPAPVGQSYLVVEKIIEAARTAGAQAIHPGYGFLSENAAFAEACEKSGIVFIGPDANAIELMGNKRLSKLRMIEAGVPCVPGYEGADQDDATLLAEAKKIGMPVMVKAAAGGGGRGMRLVKDENELAEAIKSARSEAENAFGSGELILEKAVIEPRHVEIQVFADTHGNVVHLGERDCSIQRRHQKIVEEAPSPAVTPAIREAMGKAATDAAAAINYRGAGTVEFLLDASGEFYFLEMNTRLQVEHPVTEEITGLDLVAWQLAVAQGEELPLSQEEIILEGHAIEVRLYAEDPGAGFLPQTGPVHVWRPAITEGVRIDDGLVEGQQITPFYDPMIAKVIARGPTREAARRRLVRAVEDSLLLGPRSNKEFLAAALKHPEFAAGNATTAFIDQHLADSPLLQPQTPDAGTVALMAALLFDASAEAVPVPKLLQSWRSANPADSDFILAFGEEKHEARVQAMGPRRYTASVGEERFEIAIERWDQPYARVTRDGVTRTLGACVVGRSLFIDDGGRVFHAENATYAEAQGADGAGEGVLRAPMDGRIVAVNAKSGDTVAKGQTLIVLEAMKMEHQIKSGVDGVLGDVNVAAGDQVGARAILATVEPADASATG